MGDAGDRIREHLGLTDAERVVPTGSMWPVIRPGDAIRFRRAQAAPRPGEIWVARQGELHLVHRVLWVRPDGRALLKGDFRAEADGWLPRGALFGRVSHIRKGETWRPTNRRRDRALGLAWSATATAYLLTRRALGALKRGLTPPAGPSAAPPGSGSPP